jgi:hypothetical protein
MSVWFLSIVNSQLSPIRFPLTPAMHRRNTEPYAQGYDRSWSPPASPKKALTVIGGRASIAVVYV